MKSVKIKNAAIDQKKVAEQLKRTMAQIPDLGDLTTFGPPQLHTPATGDTSAKDMIRPLINYIPRATLEEPKFISPTPVIGPLLVAIRRAWNWMSTKWFVLPILTQQSEVNADLLIFLIKSVQIQEKQAERITELEMRLAQLETQLKQNLE